MNDEPEYIQTFDPTGKPLRERHIGPYRILQRLGEGGMGEVFEAEQTAPVRRKVALKLIKRGMDSKEVLARFEAERQALALMDHPNIAQVYDTGTTDDGRPFFAMENVHGVPITEYCNRVRMSPGARLELFAQVCDGVQHAHQKGIIHRDLKPTNVLVALHDDRPVPKIIDFGIAKALSYRLTDRTMFTEIGQIMGTPEYMSPEQAEMGRLDVDTRTDVYSLGVLLYELLTGELPFPTEALRRDGLDAFRKHVLESDPPRPSTRLSRADEATRLRARERGSDPPALSRALRGDLDWIAMKALEKDRTRRYASTSELAADVRRYLRNEPVLASPPSRLYRVRKFVLRHKAGSLFAGVLTVLLTAFAATMAVQRAVVARERDRAERALDTANQVSEYLIDLFERSDPNEDPGRTISARDLLDRGAARIADLAGQPLIQARLEHTMARIYSGNGLGEDARILARRALDKRQAALGPDAPEVAATMDLLAGILVQLRDFTGARTYYERALAIRRDRLGAEHPDTLSTLNNLANLYLLLGERPRALELHGEVLRIRERTLPPDSPQLAVSLNNMATLLVAGGELERARPLYERALAILERAHGPEHTNIALAAQALAELHMLEGDDDGARGGFERALAIREHLLGPDSAEVAWSLLPLTELLFRQGERERAERLHERAERILGRHEPGPSFRSLYHAACWAALHGDREQALALVRQSAEQPDFSAYLLDSPSLAALREDPAFRQLESRR